MALTRKMLAAMDIPAEKIDEIINAHTETVDALKEDRDKFKADAEKLTKVQSQLEEVKKELAKVDEGDWEQRYKDLTEEYNKYRTDVENKATRSTKEAVYRKLLKEAGVSEKRIDTIMRVSDIDSIKIGKDGSVEDASTVTENIKKEWADFIVTTKETGADTPNPPANAGGAKKTKEEIMKIKDTSERQKAWADYLNNKEE